MPKGLRSIELPQSSCNQEQPNWEKLDAVYENLLRREDVLRSFHRAPRSGHWLLRQNKPPALNPAGETWTETNRASPSFRSCFFGDESRKLAGRVSGASASAYGRAVSS